MNKQDNRQDETFAEEMNEGGEGLMDLGTDLTEEVAESRHGKRRGRGKATGDLKLSQELLDLNAVMQSQFIRLRESLFVSDKLSRLEQVRQQRQILAKRLGVHEKLIKAVEKTKSTLPGTVIFRLIQIYHLSADYFCSTNAALSDFFTMEQKMLEFECKFSTLQSSNAGNSESGKARLNELPFMRRGGWLKGMPRKPKSEDDLRLIALYEESRRKRYIPISVADLRRWANENGIDIYALTLPDIPIVKVVNAKKSAKDRRRGGWLKGMPRKDLTPEQQEWRRIWDTYRSQGIQFKSLDELRSFHQRQQDK